MKKTAAILILSAYICCASGCATGQAGGREELRPTELQNTFGAMLVIAATGGGAYLGSKLSDGSGGQNLSYGLLCGIGGGIAAGLAYWGFLYLTAKKAAVESGSEPAKAEEKVLMPGE